MNPLLPGHSGTTPEPTRNRSHNNQGTNEDGSQNDPHPEAGPFHGQTTRNVSLEEDHDSIVKDTYYIRIRKCAQQLKFMKIKRKMKNEVCCVLFTVHQFP